MAAKLRLPVSGRNNKMRLDDPLDTGQTIEEVGSPIPGGTASARRATTNSVKVGAAYVEPEQQKWWAVLPPLAKATTAVLVVILPLAGISIWWVSRLDANVENLKISVSDVKARTEELFRSSVQQQSRLDMLDKSMDTLKAESKVTTPDSPHASSRK